MQTVTYAPRTPIAAVPYTYDGMPSRMPAKVAAELLRRLRWAESGDCLESRPDGRLRFPLSQLTPAEGGR